MSGITYGQWWGRMSSQAASEAAARYYDAKTEQVAEETQKLRNENELLKQQVELLKRKEKV